MILVLAVLNVAIEVVPSEFPSPVRLGIFTVPIQHFDIDIPNVLSFFLPTFSPSTTENITWILVYHHNHQFLIRHFTAPTFLYQAKNSCQYVDLPVEVMSTVCSFLQLSEWRALRLSCRAIHRISLEGFCIWYLKSICFIATNDSLRELEALAETDSIRERVQELWMIPSVFDGSHAESESAISEFAVSSRSCRPVSNDELKVRFSTYKGLVTESSSFLES